MKRFPGPGFYFWVASSLAALLGGGPARAQQSDNHILHAVPAPANLVVDGTLTKWDLSGQIDVFSNYRTRNEYSAKVAAMYDKDNLYLAILWRDPTPMYNMVDSNFDIGSGWKSDCLQLRLKTDMVMHLDCWYSTAAKHSVINIAYGRYHAQQVPPEPIEAFQPRIDAIKDGAQEVFVMGDDGKSYTQEIALPWRLITAQAAIVKATGQPLRAPKTYSPGDQFNMGMEFLWGPPDGKTFPIHRYADLLAPGHTEREFFWTAEDAWGPVVLEPKGHLNLPQIDYAANSDYLQKTAGPLKIAYTMPYDGFATLVIDDAKGHRVKNLIGMAPRSKGDTVDYWDGTDDSGAVVAPGTYHWRGLTHQGIDATYEASYGTPGNPAWDTSDGTGAWMSDHNPPVAVAAGKSMMFLTANGGEAGAPLIGTDLNGKKLWQQKRMEGLADLATDDKYLYCGMNQWWDKDVPMTIGRLDAPTGNYAPFASKPAPQLIVPIGPNQEAGAIVGLDVNTTRLAVSVSGPDVIRYFDKNTMDKLGEVAVPAVGQVAYDAAGTLFAISGTSVVKVTDAGITPVVTTHLGKPYGLAIDKTSGAFYVSDRATEQVMEFGKDGTFVRAIGLAGGRPQPGPWVPGGMRNPAGLDVDAQGRIWVAEEDMFPKRVSVWSPSGDFLEDFIGPATYGGMGAMADSDDKTRVFGDGCEWKLDYATNTAKIVSNPFNDNFVGDLVKFQGREYYLARGGALYLRKGDAYVMVAKFGNTRVTDIGKAGLPLVVPPGAKDWFTYLWCDKNDDGVAEPEEIEYNTTIPVESAGWGGYWLDENFNLRSGSGGYESQTVSTIPLKGWTAGGAPIWDMADLKIIATDTLPGPNYLYLSEHGKTIVGSPMTCFADDGTQLWQYGKDQFPGVQGSHGAPITGRDDDIYGALQCVGKADTSLGTVFAVSSNIGRLYLLTTDGLFVGSVFQDARDANDPWPTSEKAGSPLGGVTMGSEWFGGYFFKSKPTNEYYLIAGNTSYNLIKLSGLDKLTAVPGADLTFTGADMLAADRLVHERAAAKSEAQVMTISQLATAPKIDGNTNKYPVANYLNWTAGSYRVRGALAVDEANLYLAYDVNGERNPLQNGGQDPNQLFTTGDSIDLQLGTNPDADPKRTEPVTGDLRLLITLMNGKPIAVLYRWKAAGAATHPVTFTSPWRTYRVEDVQVLTDVQVAFGRAGNGYHIEAAVPLADLGFQPQAGKQYKVDLGTIYADPTGTNRAARVYWANKATGLVSDVPGEIMASPNLWGTASIK